MRKRLFWRIYLMLLASLVLVTLLGGALWKLGVEHGPSPVVVLASRMLGALLPDAGTPDAVQADALRRLAAAVEGDLVLEASDGRPIATVGSDAGVPPRWHAWKLTLPDGRRLSVRLPKLQHESVAGLVGMLGAVALAVGLAAFPVARRLTRRLERLRDGVEAWGAGTLSARVSEHGRDEVAALARSFNTAAARIERLVGAHRSLLAHASHELRSPLTRLRVALEMQASRPDPARAEEIARNLAELDTLIDEILLASRLDHLERLERTEPVDLLALAAEEAAAVGATVNGRPVEVTGDPRLLRRLVRNLLDNAAKHGAPPVEVEVGAQDGTARLVVCDQGPGVPEAERARIFEPFHRPPGASEAAGGWGLGLALVRQIAERHGGQVRYDWSAAQGSRFTVELPARKG